MDIIGPTRDVALGDGWFPLEIYRDHRFRWAENDATVHVAVLDGVQTVLRLVVEPGPGLGHQPLELTALLQDGSVLGRATVTTKQVVTLALPAEYPRAYTVTLRAAGGGKSISTDSRILNFRAFEIALERRPDVFPAWAVPGSGFYPLEQLGGATFRWVSNDAQVALSAGRPAQLVFDVEPGPGVGSKPFLLSVRDAGGAELSSLQIPSRTTVRVPVAGLESDGIVLHTDGGGQVVKTDPRALNFRVFAVQR
jgi:hypothetical protein